MKKLIGVIAAVYSLIGVMSLKEEKSSIDKSKLQVVSVSVEEMSLAPQWIQGT